MAKKFLSFLGTNAYLHTRYQINDHISEPVRYVQEALVKYLCKDWNKNDKIIIFATTGESGSIKKNWENGRFNNFDDFGLEYEPEPKGLKEKLKDLGLVCQIEMVPIPDGIEENEIWKIIEIIDEMIEREDKLFIDITHSFRYIPMIIPSMLTFLKATKGIKLHSIHYGAFEALGIPQEIKNIPLEDRIAPVRELTEIYKMIEWSEAANAFLQYGSGKRLIEQIDKAEKIDKKTRNFLNPLKNSIEKIDEALKFNNVTELKKADNLKIEKKIKLEKTPNLFALKKLSPKLEEYLYQWSDDEVENGLMAAEWCLKNDRFAQALTFAQEAMISYFCDIFDWDKSNKNHRLAVNFMVKIALGKEELEKHASNGDSWFDSTKHNALDKLKNVDRKILENFLEVSGWRNTINHAKRGDRTHMQKEFPSILQNFKNVIVGTQNA